MPPGDVPAVAELPYGGTSSQQAARELVAGSDVDAASHTMANRIRLQLHETVSPLAIKGIKAALLLLVNPNMTAKAAAEQTGTTQPTLRKCKPLVERALGLA